MVNDKMIRELKKGQKLVRFKWIDGSNIVTIIDFDLDQHETLPTNVGYKPLETAREVWEGLIREGFHTKP